MAFFWACQIGRNILKVSTPTQVKFLHNLLLKSPPTPSNDVPALISWKHIPVLLRQMRQSGMRRQNSANQQGQTPHSNGQLAMCPSTRWQYFVWHLSLDTNKVLHLIYLLFLITRFLFESCTQIPHMMPEATNSVIFCCKCIIWVDVSKAGHTGTPVRWEPMDPAGRMKWEIRRGRAGAVLSVLPGVQVLIEVLPIQLREVCSFQGKAKS